MNSKAKKAPPAAAAAVEAIVNMPPSDTDPNGSYTGRPQDPWETPVQDADDL